MTDIQLFVTIITSIVTCASVICAATPTPKDGTFWSEIYKIIEVAAMLVGKAKDTGNKNG